MSTIPPPLRVRGPHLRIALLLGIAGMLATLALMPYVLALMPQKFAMLPLPLPLVIAAQVAQAGVLCWLLGWLGLTLGARHGLDAPWLRGWVYRHQRGPRRRARWGLAMLLGALVALLIAGLSMLGPSLVVDQTTTPEGWAWRGVLASFYGGIVEEVELRLLLVSLFVWLLALSNRTLARPWMFMLAIALAAVLFGTLFWKYGLEHAMLAHFCADLLLHVGAPLFAPG